MAASFPHRAQLSFSDQRVVFSVRGARVVPWAAALGTIEACTAPEPDAWALSCCSCRLGEADVQDEVSEPQIQGSAAGPVHDGRQQDDGEDDDHQPEEEHNDSGDGVPGYGSRSSHGLQLPGAARVIRNGR
jgi:hypothetical protein